MSISIVIATYNRAGVLLRCLRSLAAQHFEPGDEIVVADNGSTDGTPRVLREQADRFAVPFHAVRESRPGKSHAVAAAVGASSGSVLAFTDDDVEVAEDWLRQIRREMVPRVALVGGRVMPRFEGRVPPWLALRQGDAFGRLASPLALLDYGPNREPLGCRTALGANLAVTREAYLAAGGFPSSLGKLRGTLLTGEDHVLCERVQQCGFTAIYAPSVVVRHLVPKNRLSLRYFLRWFFWSGVTHAAMETSRPGGRRVLGAPLYFVRSCAASSGFALASVLVGGWTGAAARIMDAAFAAGYIWASRQQQRVSVNTLAGPDHPRVEAA
jgi:glycosyltransferase involved in cell wall biosynthesis